MNAGAERFSMKIAIVSTISSGGVGVAAANLHAAFLEYGHSSRYLTMEDAVGTDMVGLDYLRHNKDRDRFWSDRIFSYWGALAPHDKLQEGGSELFSDTASIPGEFSPEAAETLRESDVVNLHWSAGIFFSPTFLRFLAGKPVVLTLHDMNAFTGGCHYHLSCTRYTGRCGNCPFMANPSEHDLSRHVHDIKKFCYAWARPAVAAPSKWLAGMAGSSSLLSAAYAADIANPHDLDFYRPMDDRGRMGLRKKFGIPKDVKVILAGAGFLMNSRKNIGMLLEAWNRLQNDCPKPNTALVLFGFGEAGDLPGLVHKTGYVTTREEMLELYQMADVFVHPSLIDNLSNTLCEAQCCGLPVIAFDAGGNKEAFLPGKSGILIEGGKTAAALEKAIANAITDADALKNMAGEAREFAESRFSGRLAVEKYLALFAQTARAGDESQIESIDRQLTNHQAVLLASCIRDAFDRISLLEQELHRHRSSWLKRQKRRLRRIFHKR